MIVFDGAKVPFVYVNSNNMHKTELKKLQNQNKK
jgi:hypothetical protein